MKQALETPIYVTGQDLLCFSGLSNSAKCFFQALLDRGFGKPRVEIQNTSADVRDALEQVGRVLDERKAN